VLLGFMGLLDVRLNTLTAIWTILSIGLTIDYSAHVLFRFTASADSASSGEARGARGALGARGGGGVGGGARTARLGLGLGSISSSSYPSWTRIADLLVDVGIPVFHGGISTLLGLICLAFSNSYLFQTFCVLGIVVVVSGVFHALVVLPSFLYLGLVATSRCRHARSTSGSAARYRGGGEGGGRGAMGMGGSNGGRNGVGDGDGRERDTGDTVDPGNFELAIINGAAGEDDSASCL